MSRRVAAVVVAAAACVLPAQASVSAPPRAVGCTPAQTRALVSGFLSAFNRGDGRALDAVWASKAWFRWYSVTTEPGARTPQDAARRDLLLGYFAERHVAGERLTLTTLKINGVSSGGYRNFELRLSRGAVDLPGSSVAYVGKGASTCSTGRLFVWGMGAAR
jgi:hypothetical protein